MYIQDTMCSVANDATFVQDHDLRIFLPIYVVRIKEIKSLFRRIFKKPLHIFYVFSPQKVSKGSIIQICFRKKERILT